VETITYYAFWSGMIFAGIAMAVEFTYAMAPRLGVRTVATTVGTVPVAVAAILVAAACGGEAETGPTASPNASPQGSSTQTPTSVTVYSSPT
jgi:hypothetical protein